MNEVALQHVIGQQRPLLKRGDRRSILPPTIKDLRLASAALTERIVIEIQKTGNVYTETLGVNDGDFDEYMQSRRFDAGTMLLLNRFNGSNQVKVPSSLVQSVPDGEEYLCSDRKGIRIGIFSPYGLGIAMREDEKISKEWMANRELVISWQKSGQHLQVVPFYENSRHDDIFGIYDMIDKFLSNSKSSFMIRVPTLECVKLNHDYIINNFVRAFLFTWDDLEGFTKKGLGSTDIFTSSFDWNAFWLNSMPAPEPVASKDPEIISSGKKYISCGVPNDHKEIMRALFEHERTASPVSGKVLILNFDSHNDQGYGDYSYLHKGNWAFFAEKEGRARVVHFQSYYRDNGSPAWSEKDVFNWNTEARRTSILKEIRSILNGENINSIWLSIDFDAFSLNQPTDYEPGWTVPVFHLGKDEVKSELMALKDFLSSNGIIINRILRFSSMEYLNLPEENKNQYIVDVDNAISTTLISDMY